MERIVLFDGVCNFCNGLVNFIIRHDNARKFKFAPLQSKIGKDLRAKYDVAENTDSIILIENDQAFLHSTAALRVARQIGGIYSLSYVFIVVPAFIRNWAYKMFAKYRYGMFGKTDTCMIPTPDVKERFLSL